MEELLIRVFKFNDWLKNLTWWINARVNPTKQASLRFSWLLVYLCISLGIYFSSCSIAPSAWQTHCSSRFYFTVFSLSCGSDSRSAWVFIWLGTFPLPTLQSGRHMANIRSAPRSSSLNNLTRLANVRSETISSELDIIEGGNEQTCNFWPRIINSLTLRCWSASGGGETDERDSYRV